MSPRKNASVEAHGDEHAPDLRGSFGTRCQALSNRGSRFGPLKLQAFDRRLDGPRRLEMPAAGLALSTAHSSASVAWKNANRSSTPSDLRGEAGHVAMTCMRIHSTQGRRVYPNKPRWSFARRSCVNAILRS
jgi:hypothetical protein